MPIDELIASHDRERLDHLMKFVTRRQMVYYRRHVLEDPPPWTDDPILREYHFTNVYRELDPGTEFCVEHILDRPDKTRAERVFNVMAYRLVGRERTYQNLDWLELGEGFNQQRFQDTIERMRAGGQSAWSKAYMVCYYRQMGGDSMEENVGRLLRQLAQDNWNGFWEDLNNAETRHGAWEVIQDQYGWGRFLAFQVLVDLCYPLPNPFGEWVDEGNAEPSILPFSNYRSWATAGPGTLRGLQRIWPDCTQTQANELMAWLESHFQVYLYNNTRIRGEPLFPVPISRANVANCLCEWDKYRKIEDGGGRGRRYIPRTEIPGLEAS